MNIRPSSALLTLFGFLLLSAQSQGQEKKLPAALVPTKIQLSFDNTPIDQAVAELSRKVGYLVFLDDADGKVKNRKVTLDTGEVTYWEAVEKLCRAANLVEGLPAISLTSKTLPKLPPAPKPGEKIPLIKIGDGTPMFRTIRGVLVLKDGKPPTVSADTTSAVRVKASRTFYPASTPTEITCGIKVSPEPRMRWNDLLGIRIDRAIDEHGQALQVSKKTGVPKFGGSFGGGPPQAADNDNVANFAVRLNKGAKETKTLKELKGVLTASVSVFGVEIVAVNDVIKSQGKLVRGAKIGTLKVGATTMEGPDVQFTLELNVPAQYLPQVKLGFSNSSAPLPGLKVLDGLGKPIPIVSMTPTNPNVPAGGAGEYQVRIRPATDQTLTKVSYWSRPNVTLEIPFSLKNVAVP